MTILERFIYELQIDELLPLYWKHVSWFCDHLYVNQKGNVAVNSINMDYESIKDINLQISKCVFCINSSNKEKHEMKKNNTNDNMNMPTSHYNEYRFNNMFEFNIPFASENIDDVCNIYTK
eukprot:151068_1